MSHDNEQEKRHQEGKHQVGKNIHDVATAHGGSHGGNMSGSTATSDREHMMGTAKNTGANHSSYPTTKSSAGVAESQRGKTGPEEGSYDTSRPRHSTEHYSGSGAANPAQAGMIHGHGTHPRSDQHQQYFKDSVKQNEGVNPNKLD